MTYCTSTAKVHLKEKLFRRGNIEERKSEEENINERIFYESKTQALVLMKLLDPLITNLSDQEKITLFDAIFNFFHANFYQSIRKL